MNTLLVLFAVIFAVSIIESFEFEDSLSPLFQSPSNDDNEIISPKPIHKLRRKRDDSKKTHYCGSVLNKKIAEVCNSCSRNPNTNAIKRKRDISPFLEQKIRTKREDGIVALCCKKGCTKSELKSYCC
uniref:Insulin-like domain-containing protein n=1 Tax=Panagrolaimus sp. PS1159 TaxID=55785 RepID=A0AC35G7F1_9BILA